MVRGLFVGNTPYIQLVVGWGQVVQSPHVVLDTGFTGDIQVTSKMAKELGLQPIAVMPMGVANGEVIQVPTALAFVAMEGAQEYVQAFIAGNTPLAGIGLFTKFQYKAVVDCVARDVTLQKV